MAIEIGKARRAKDSTEEFAGIVFVGPTHQKARVLDLRTVSGQIQLKLETEEGKIAWFAAEPGDTLRIERRIRQRKEDTSLAGGQESAKKRRSPITQLDLNIRLLRGNGDEFDVLEIWRFKGAIELLLQDPMSSNVLDHRLQPGDVLQLATPQPTAALSVQAAVAVGVEAPTLGERVRAQILSQIAESDAQGAGSNVFHYLLEAQTSSPRSSAAKETGEVVYRVRTPRGRYEVRRDEDDAPNSFWEGGTGMSRSMAVWMALLLLPLGISVYTIFNSWHRCSYGFGSSAPSLEERQNATFYEIHGIPAPDAGQVS